MDGLVGFLVLFGIPGFLFYCALRKRPFFEPSVVDALQESCRLSDLDATKMRKGKRPSQEAISVYRRTRAHIDWKLDRRGASYATALAYGVAFAHKETVTEEERENFKSQHPEFAEDLDRPLLPRLSSNNARGRGIAAGTAAGAFAGASLFDDELFSRSEDLTEESPSGLFDDGSISSTFDDDSINSLFSDDGVNPATGLPMCGGLDTEGNPFGCGSISSDIDDAFSSGFDDTFSSIDDSFSSSDDDW